MSIKEVKFFDGYSTEAVPTTTTYAGETGMQGATGLTGSDGSDATTTQLSDVSPCTNTTSDSIYIGTDTGETSGTNSVGIGYQALQNDNGSYQVGIGYQACNSSSGGVGNIGLGYRGCQFGSTSNYAIGIGFSSGPRSTGTNNYAIGIGYQAQAAGNSTVIGYNSNTSAENSIVIGDNMNDLIESGVSIPDNCAILGGENVNFTVLRGVVHFEPIAQPSTAVEGDTYFDSTSHKLRYFNGTAWVDC